MSEACKAPGKRCLASSPVRDRRGTSISGIGHADDHRAWSQLAEARDVVESASQADDQARQQAREEDPDRRGQRLVLVVRATITPQPTTRSSTICSGVICGTSIGLLQRPAPDELFVTNISVGAQGATQIDPIGLISPTLDGEDSSYFEWLAAGDVDIREVLGAMHQADRPRRILTGIKFGFDPERLLIRLDVANGPWTFWPGLQLRVTFLEPEGIRVAFGQTEGRYGRRCRSATAT